MHECLVQSLLALGQLVLEERILKSLQCNFISNKITEDLSPNLIKKKDLNPLYPFILEKNSKQKILFVDNQIDIVWSEWIIWTFSSDKLKV